MDSNEISKMLYAFGELYNLKMSKEICELIKPKEIVDAYESDQINEIATALSKTQGELPPVLHNRDNAFFHNSYADLHAIMSTIRPTLSKNGLSLSQFTKIGVNGEIVLHTRLRHSSGQWIETRSRIIPEKGDIQSYGRAVSYHRRYGIMALIGITASNDSSDDDAEGLMDKHRDMSATSTLNKYEPTKQSYVAITTDQLEELEMELDGYPDLASRLKASIKIEQLCDMPKSMFLDTIKKIREHKIRLSEVRK